MSNNDLSDNGKNFKFGYDSENDSYGYYKNGTFTQFGGGSSMTPTFIFSQGGRSSTSGNIDFVCIYYTDGTVFSSGIVTGSYASRVIMIDNEYLKCTSATNGTWTVDITNYKSCIAKDPNGIVRELEPNTTYTFTVSANTVYPIYVFEN